MSEDMTTMKLGTWVPTAAQLKAIRAYCAMVEDKKPRQIVIEIGERYNIHDPRMATHENLCVVSTEGNAMDPEWGWDDTDLSNTNTWASFKEFGVELDRWGRCVLDFYIYAQAFGDYHGELLGNAQVYVRTIDGVPTIVGFSATLYPFQKENIA